MINPQEEILFKIGVLQPITTGDDGDIGAAIDTAGFNTVIVRQLFHSRTDNPTTGAGAFSMNLRESTGSTGTYAAITDAVGANNATVSLGVQDLASGTASQGLIYCDLRNRDRYLKANIDLTTGSTGGAALGDLSIDFLLCNSKIVKPVIQTAITSAT